MDLTLLARTLEATLSPDTRTIQDAQISLEQAAKEDLGLFLSALAAVLADVSKSQPARSAAGLQLKNQLTSKDADSKVQQQMKWLSHDVNLRQRIKNLVLSALGTEIHQFRTAAQCVAYLAAAELQMNTWPELIPTLLNNVTSPQSTEQLMEASLDSIGYICEDLEPKFLANQCNEILTAIVHGMRKEEPSNNVRLAATKALLNSLEFTKANFEKENERHLIMQVVCEATQCNQEQIQVAALQNLVKIMSLYYIHMEAYMGPALFAITLEAMKSSKDKVALQGIEFWSSVCDEEADLSIEAAEALESGRPPEQTSKFYVKGAMQYLVPVLLEILTQQDEFDDEDDWNPCKAAGVCLSLMAGCCEDDILTCVCPFVLENMCHANWQWRDAAIMSLGSIMEGPDPDTLQKNVEPLAEPLISLMVNDEMVQVRDSAAWTIGRVCERCPGALLNDKYLMPLLKALLHCLSAEPRVAGNTCWAISSLAEAAYDAVEDMEVEEPDTYCLSTSFEVIVGKLLETTDRSDSGLNNLRTSAYEALMDMIKYSAKDCYPVVRKTIVVVMSKLKLLLESGSTMTGSDRQQVSDVCSLLCATLQSLLRKVNKEDALQIKDEVMQCMVGLLQSSGGQGSSGGAGVQEDAITTIGVLVEIIGDVFLDYMKEFKQYLLVTLQNVSEVQVCLAAVGLVGDLCRVLSAKIEPSCRELLEAMVVALVNENVHRSIKPPILSVVGDMALAIGQSFCLYLESILPILQQAAKFQVDRDSFDMIDYHNELKDGCLEAYIGIIQGLKAYDRQYPNHVIVSVPVMMELIVSISNDEDKSESNLSNALGLLGDLCTTFGVNLPTMIEGFEHALPALNKLLLDGKRSRVKRTKTVGLWAAKELKHIQPQNK